MTREYYTLTEIRIKTLWNTGKNLLVFLCILHVSCWVLVEALLTSDAHTASTLQILTTHGLYTERCIALSVQTQYISLDTYWVVCIFQCIYVYIYTKVCISLNMLYIEVYICIYTDMSSQYKSNERHTFWYTVYTKVSLLSLF